MPKRIGNLYQKFISPENWQLAKKKAFQNKKHSLSVKRYESHGEEYTETIRKQFENGTFKLLGYSTKTIYEPKERVLYIARIEERVFHWATMLIIEPIFEKILHYHSYSCRVGKGQHKGALANSDAVRKYKYVIDIDASKFYPSIPHDRLKKDFERKIKDKEFLEKTVFKIIDSHHTPNRKGYGVPIGNYTSQIFGNIYMTKLDNFCSRLDGVKKVIRYSDNSLIFFNDKTKAQAAKKAIEQFYTDVLDMRMSKCELYPTKQGVDFVGYRSFKNTVLLRKRTKKRIRKRINKLPKILAHKQITLEKAMGQVASALGWSKYARCKKFREELGLKEKLEEIKNELRLRKLA